MSLLAQLDKNIAARGGLMVSCQSVPGSPLDKPETVAAMALVKSLNEAGYRVIAEGRYNTTAQAGEAMRHGAWAVTVGSAITRLEHICEWYNTALKRAVL